MSQIVLPYDPYPKQREFHADPHRYKLFGGAAGPGKSMSLVMEGVQTAIDFPGVKVLMLRRTFPQLTAGLLDYHARYVPRELVEHWNGKDHIATLKNGSMVRYGSCRFEEDAWQYQGHEYVVILFDEICQFTYKIWTTLKSWNRSTIAGTFPWMGGAGNPVGVGLGWVKALFVDKKPWIGMDESEARAYNPSQWGFTSATYKDNPLYANDANYELQLESLPTALRLALKEGRWDVLAGSYFDIFDQALHVYGDQGLISPWSPRWVSVDWGYDHPAAIYFHAQEGDVTYTYKELVARRLGPRELARLVVDLAEGDSLEQCYMGPDAWAKRTDEAPIAEQIADEFLEAGLPAPEPASNDRIGGWMLLYQLMKYGKWKIHQSCQHLIETLPILVRDEDNREDILKVTGDDPADSARYGLYSRMKGRRQPFEQRVLAKLTEKDPVLQAMQLQMLMDREAKAENGGVIAQRAAGRYARWYNQSRRVH